MSERSLISPPADLAEPGVAPPQPPKRDLFPWLYGLGFVILAGGILYVWQHPVVAPEESAARQLIEQRLGDAGSRITLLEQRPPPDLGKLTARVEALDARFADQANFATKLDTLSGRIESLSARGQTAQDTTKQQLDALNARVAAVEANNGTVATTAKRLNRVARLQEASFALASGRPLGDVPDAPDAVKRYARVAAPTEAQLRQRFGRAEQAALAMTPPVDTGDTPFIDRVWDRAQTLITIHRGDEVVVGNSSATALGRAEVALEAGDLAAAVDAVGSLKGQPAQALADWLADAKALLAARSALASMADKV